MGHDNPTPPTTARPPTRLQRSPRAARAHPAGGPPRNGPGHQETARSKGRRSPREPGRLRPPGGCAGRVPSLREAAEERGALKDEALESPVCDADRDGVCQEEPRQLLPSAAGGGRDTAPPRPHPLAPQVPTGDARGGLSPISASWVRKGA